MFFGCKALSFIPEIYIIPVFESLLEKAHQLNDINLNNFMKYFENEWIKGTEFSYWNYYNEFEIKTNNPSEGYNYKLNSIFKNKRPFLYHALYEYRILIKESYDNYIDNMAKHSSQIVQKDPLRNEVKNILDKFDNDYINLRKDNENINDDMDIDVNYDEDGLYELYSRHWLNCVLAISRIIKNVDLS